MADFNSSFDMPSASLSENAESAELQRLIAVEQQKAQFQAQVTSVPPLYCHSTPVLTSLVALTVFNALFIGSQLYRCLLG